MVPNFIGIVPVSLFHAKSSTVRLVRRVSAPGSRPERLLWSSLSEVRQLSPPIASGIAPAVVTRVPTRIMVCIYARDRAP